MEFFSTSSLKFSHTDTHPFPLLLFMDWSTLDSSVLQYLLEFAQIHVCWDSDVIQPSHPLLPPSPPAPNLSQYQDLFQWVGSLHQMTKHWSFSFSISPSNEYAELISFRIDWFDLLAVQGTLKSLLQHHISKASILQHSAFVMVPSLENCLSAVGSCKL